jgi:hypothetical protein
MGSTATVKGQASRVQPFECILLEGLFYLGNDSLKQKEKNIMKSGLIIYVAGNAPDSWTEENEVSIKNTESKADLIEIITTKTGHFDIIDAWRELTTRGMSTITCKLACFNDAGSIEMTNKTLRLCG